VIGRRRFTGLGLGLGAAAALGWPATGKGGPAMASRKIPSSGEAIPVVGLGTWQTFDLPSGAGAAARAPLVQVMAGLLAAGGTVVDSSPMYGRAEEVVGDVLAELHPAASPFLATKVWTRGGREGEAQLAESMRRFRVRTLDLAQVHNLLDVDVHLPMLRERKRSGVVRYVGITHYTTSAFADLERRMRAGPVDFVQLPYSVTVRDAEKRLLPAAAEAGVAVLVNRPFEEGAMFRTVKGRPLPSYAAELGCTAWSQLFLKFILAHPAVTCVIPATADPRHLAENVAAGSGPLPDEALRERIAAELR